MATARERLLRPRAHCGWPWPEDRLTYANALLPHALWIAGEYGRDPALEAQACSMLEWLVEHEFDGRRFSFTPVDGGGPTGPRQYFDQQPIEAALMAEACAYAYRRTEDKRWLAFAESAAAWFDGDNVLGAVMHDPFTGGGYDGLRSDGPNTNEGAESTLAYVSTMVLVNGLKARATSSTSSAAAR